VTPSGRWVAEYYPCESVSEQADGGLVIKLRVSDRRWLRRVALRLGGTGRVVDPPDLAAQVVADAREALAAYGERPA
ncbi:MAG: WYL domain-containing protein, partial [Actinomycetota bacterium]